MATGHPLQKLKASIFTTLRREKLGIFPSLEGLETSSWLEGFATYQTDSQQAYSYFRLKTDNKLCESN
ncbi:hypothetical protein ACFX1X_015044 [Malus domestica]